jgi:hypothetical protein
MVLAAPARERSTRAAARRTGTPLQRYARKEVIAALSNVAASWNELLHADQKAATSDGAVIIRPPIQIIAIGNRYGGPLRKNHPPKNGNPFHASHDVGVDVDIGLPRNDGKIGTCKYWEAEYSRELTRRAISLFLSETVLSVSVVFFDDPDIGLPKQLVHKDRHSNHNDHFHVRFVHPPGVFP